VLVPLLVAALAAQVATEPQVRIGPQVPPQPGLQLPPPPAPLVTKGLCAPTYSCLLTAASASQSPDIGVPLVDEAPPSRLSD